jgi:hypothetical protein
MSLNVNKRKFTNSEQVYVNCLNTHNANIINKDLVKTYQSNAMRISQKLTSTNLGGRTIFVDRGVPNEFGRYEGQQNGSGGPLRNKF